MSNSDTESSWVDPDDAPELGDEWFRKAWAMDGDRVIRAGEGPDPRLPPERRGVVHVDEQVLRAWRATGPGWEARIGEMLRKAVDV